MEMQVGDNNGLLSPGPWVLLGRPRTPFSSGTAMLQPEQDGLVAAGGITQH